MDYDQKWPCCSGTFPQITADYGISSYLRGPGGIYVNLYAPSKVTWQQGSARVSLEQQTQYPVANETSLRLKLDRPERFAVRLRIPAWSDPQTRIAIHGKAESIAAQPGTWAKINRIWKDGDRIELMLDMPLRLVPIDPQHPNLVALVRGPVALFALEPEANGASAAVTRQQLLAATQAGPASNRWTATGANGTVQLVDYPAITDERYRLYQPV